MHHQIRRKKYNYAENIERIAVQPFLISPFTTSACKIENLIRKERKNSFDLITIIYENDKLICILCVRAFREIFFVCMCAFNNNQGDLHITESP